MTDGKPAPPSRTPFDRFSEVVRRIITVPKSEVDKKMRAFKRRKNPRNQARPLSGQV